MTASFVNGDKVMYLTDDRDHQDSDLRSLVIFPGGNGDWYVQVAGKNGRTVEGVRICTSGGAASRCPGLGAAISSAYRAMVASAKGEAPPESVADLMIQNERLQAEVRAWREKAPKYEFDGLFDIVAKQDV